MSVSSHQKFQRLTRVNMPSCTSHEFLCNYNTVSQRLYYERNCFLSKVMTLYFIISLKWVSRNLAHEANKSYVSTFSFTENEVRIFIELSTKLCHVHSSPFLLFFEVFSFLCFFKETLSVWSLFLCDSSCGNFVNSFVEVLIDIFYVQWMLLNLC